MTEENPFHETRSEYLKRFEPLAVLIGEDDPGSWYLEVYSEAFDAPGHPILMTQGCESWQDILDEVTSWDREIEEISIWGRGIYYVQEDDPREAVPVA